MPTALLFDDLEREEGRRLEAYQDTGGVWTIGYGHTGREVHAGLTWTAAEATLGLERDAARVCEGLDTAIGWWGALDGVRQDVLANMAFNIGVHGLLRFADMMRSVRGGDYGVAGVQMLRSDWAKAPPVGVGARASRLAAMMKTGLRPDA